MRENVRYKTVSNFISPQKKSALQTIKRENSAHSRKYFTPPPKIRTLEPDTKSSSVQRQNQKVVQANKNRLKRIISFAQQGVLDYSHDNPQMHIELSKRMKKQNENDEQHLAKQYLVQCNKQQKHKKQLYSTFRSKFIKKFPSMKKYYTEYNTDSEPTPSFIQSKIIQTIVSSKRDSKKDSIDVRSSHKSSKPKATTLEEELNKSLEEIPQKKVQNFVKDVMKLGFFFSRSQKRCLTSFMEYQEPKPEYKVKDISHFHYLKYQKDRKPFKKFKEGMTKAQKISKVRRMMANQIKILEIEEQGTQAYSILKKSLEEAIQLDQ